MTGTGNKTIGPGSFILQHLPLRHLSRPKPDTVHLWHLDFHHLSNPLSSEGGVDYTSLSVFQQRTNRRFYLRLLLGAYLGLPGKDVVINRRIKGRPELDLSQSNGELDFSVARSGSSYLIGISSGASIGVDLEVAKRRAGNPLALAERYFSEAETATLKMLGEDRLQEAFMRTWACKEAIVKASGLGIANQLCRFTVEVNPDQPPAVLDMPDDDHREWRLAFAKPSDTKIAAIAVRQRHLNVEAFTLG